MKPTGTTSKPLQESTPTNMPTGKKGNKKLIECSILRRKQPSTSSFQNKCLSRSAAGTTNSKSVMTESSPKTFFRNSTFQDWGETEAKARKANKDAN